MDRCLRWGTGAAAIVAAALSMWRLAGGGEWRFPCVAALALAGFAMALTARTQDLRGSRAFLVTVLLATWASAMVVAVALVLDLAATNSTSLLWPPRPAWWWPLLVGAMFALVIGASFRNHRRGATLAISSSIAAVLLILAVAGYQELVLRRYGVEWRRLGWPVDRSDLLPASVDRDCANWTQALAAFESGRRPSTRISWDAATCALVSAEPLGDAIQTAADSDYSAWFDRWNSDVIAAMSACNVIDPRWPDDEEKTKTNFDMSRWSELAAVRALAHAVADERLLAVESCRSIATAAGRLRTPGHPVIDALFAFAVEKRAAIAWVGVLATAGPGDAVERLELLRRASPDLGWIRAVADAERAFIYEACRGDAARTLPEPEVAVTLGRAPEAEWWRLPLLARIRRFPSCRDTLDDAATFRHWLDAWPVAEGRTPWAAAHWKKLQPSKTFRGLAEGAGVLVTMWRVALAVDTVLRHVANAGELPKSADELSDWPKDPFDDQPLRYRRLTATRFVAYGVGADGIDDGGGALSFDHRSTPTAADIGVDILVR